MSRIKILIAEDSATVRGLLCDVVGSDPELELVGVAEDGGKAVEMAKALRPDVITMDMMMPVMTGLAATEQIMAFCPTPILVVSSSFNRGELFKMYDALRAGAVDVLEKPSGEEPQGDWEARFLSTVKLVSRIRVITHLRARSRPSNSARTDPSVSSADDNLAVKIIAIGASTGGPAAAVEVFRNLPVDIGLPILFVLHINPQFGGAFADWLDTQSPWPARFPRDGELVSGAAGQIILAPPDRHMIVRDGRIMLDDGPERFSCRPSVDVLFESVAREYGASSLAALLTGMGRDGALGLLALRQSGARTIAQDEATSVVYGMPREAVALGAAGRVLPLNEIGPTLTSLSRARVQA